MRMARMASRICSAKIEEISYRTTGSPNNIEVAYDDDTAWPLTWYLRDFPNQRYYGAQPGVDLSNVPVIIVGDNNYGVIEPIVRDNYYRQDFIRMVWPNMDYFNLTRERIKNALVNRDIRAGLMSIWLQRDYLPYANALAKSNPGVFHQWLSLQRNGVQPTGCGFISERTSPAKSGNTDPARSWKSHLILTRAAKSI